MSAETPVPIAKRSPAWKLALNLAILVGLVGVFAWQVYKSREAIASFNWSVNWGLAALALLLLLACSTLDILIWNRTLGWFTAPLPFRLAAPVYIWSFIARYIPGKVFSLILRAALAAKVGREPVPVLAASTVELALRTASGFTLFIIMLFHWRSTVNPALNIAGYIIIPLVLICAHPRVMLPVMNWGLRKIKQQPIARTLGYMEVLGVFVALLARWVVYGVSYTLLATAFYPPAQANLHALIGLASGAWAAGFAFMTPAGMGTAELAQQKFLQGVLHFLPAIAVTLPMLARLWTLLAEGLWSLAAWGLWTQRGAVLGSAVRVPEETPILR